MTPLGADRPAHNSAPPRVEVGRFVVSQPGTVCGITTPRARPAMQTVHLPGEQPTPDTAIDPKRVPLARLAGRSGGSLALTRAVAAGVAKRGPVRVAVAAFQSSV